jgi:hypothetical protein
MNQKQLLYLFLWLVAGGMLGFLIAGVIELKSLIIFGELTLQSVLYGIMITEGVILGLMVGPVAWRKIYVEGARGEKYLVKSKK